jgi:hypothetical protein
MRLLICFRGDTTRIKNVEGFTLNIFDKIIHPLEQNNIGYDILFSTYNNNKTVLDEMSKSLQPLDTLYYTKSGQINTFLELVNFLKTNSQNTNIYDYIIILRFDIIYKIDIIKWDFFNKNGIICPFKEVSEQMFDIFKYYSDTIFIFSKEYVPKILRIVSSMVLSDFLHNGQTMHTLSNYLLHQNIPLNTLCTGYYQSNTNLNFGDKLCNPLYIMLHYKYEQPDKHLYLQYL